MQALVFLALYIMKLKTLMTGLALLCSTYLSAAVTITVPEEIKVVAVNGQEFNQGLLNKKKQYQLASGLQDISLRYQEFFQHADNSHDIVKSQVFNLVTPELKDGNYVLKLIDAPQDFESAKQYKQQPVVGLYDDNKQLILKKAADQFTKKPSLNFVSNTFAINQSESLNQVKNSDINALDQQLIRLWQQASISERQKFMNWIAEQAK